MRIEFTHRADKDYRDLPKPMQRRVEKQLTFLLNNLRHTSLDAKKYGGTDDVWQGRVNRDYRFYFRIVDDAYRILMIVPHPK